MSTQQKKSSKKSFLALLINKHRLNREKKKAMSQARRAQRAIKKAERTPLSHTQKLYTLSSPFDQVRFYMVVNPSSRTLYVIVCDKKQAKEYIERRLYYTYLSKFKAYCALHHIKDTSFVSWIENANRIFPELQAERATKFTILPVDYTQCQLATVLRTTVGIPPIGASYETGPEIDYFNSFGVDPDVISYNPEDDSVITESMGKVSASKLEEIKAKENEEDNSNDSSSGSDA